MKEEAKQWMASLFRLRLPMIQRIDNFIKYPLAKRTCRFVFTLAVGILVGLTVKLFASDGVAEQVLTPDGVVIQVLANNPELRGVQADLEAAQGQRIQAGLWKNPDLNIMYANRRVQNADTSLDHGFSDFAGLTQTFEFPGKATLRKALADKDVLLAREGVEQFKAALASRAKLLAYRYSFAEQNRMAAVLVVERSRELASLLEKRPKDGMQAIFDAGILRGNFAEITTTERELEQEALSVRAELNVLRGWPPETPIRVVIDPIRPLPSDFDRFCVKSMATSPILKLKEMELMRAKTQVGVTKMDAYPDFAIQPYYSLDKAGDHDQKIGANLTVTLPLWNQNQGNITTAQANAVKAETTVQQARKDLELSLAHDFELRRLIAKQIQECGPDAISKMGDLADLADRQYRLGAINLQTFLETQRQFLSTVKSLNQAYLDDATAQMDIELLSGWGVGK